MIYLVRVTRRFECRELSSAKTADEWASVLHVADKYGFLAIRRLAIKSLADVATYAEKIVCGREHGIRAFLIGGYLNICNQTDFLTEHDFQKLPADDIALIARKREMLLDVEGTRRTSSSGKKGKCVTAKVVLERGQMSEEDIESYFSDRFRGLAE